MKYILIQDGQVPEEIVMHICDTRADRIKATQIAIFGTDDLTTDEMDEWMKCEESLAELGIVSFEGDPSLKWREVGAIVSHPTNKQL
jgi:hypothetical protein